MHLYCSICRRRVFDNGILKCVCFNLAMALFYRWSSIADHCQLFIKEWLEKGAPRYKFLRRGR